VEVDRSPGLVLGHLAALDAHGLFERALRHPCRTGKLPGQVGHGPLEQAGGPGVPDHQRLMLEALGAEWLPETGLASLVANRASQRPAMRAALPGISGPARKDPFPLAPVGVHRSEGRSGEGHEDLGVADHRLGNSLPASAPATTTWNPSFCQRDEHDGHSAARQLPHATSRGVVGLSLGGVDLTLLAALPVHVPHPAS